MIIEFIKVYKTIRLSTQVRKAQVYVNYFTISAKGLPSWVMLLGVEFRITGLNLIAALSIFGDVIFSFILFLAKSLLLYG